MEKCKEDRFNSLNKQCEVYAGINEMAFCKTNNAGQLQKSGGYNS